MTLERPKFVEHVLGGRVAGGVSELAEDWSLEMFFLRITIRAGFLTDGASVPALLQRWAGHPFDWPRIVAALVHDWLYASHMLPRWIADLMFLAILIYVGYPFWRSLADWWAVSRFGESAYYHHGTDDQAFARAHGSIRFVIKPQRKDKTNE